jgi:hypothetical protein
MIVFSEEVPRLPNTTLFTVPGLKAETAVIGFDLAGIAVSSGSACSSGKVQPSHVLEAMGFGRNWRRERCGSVWAGLPRRQTLIWPFRLGESSPNTLLKGDETRLERF